MTTIIVVAIVALVFFVSVCTIAFMVWKRETEMRTDSLRGIETGLNEVIYELSGNGADNNKQRARAYETDFEYVNRPKTYQRNLSLTRKNNYSKTNNDRDPFSWVRTTGRDSGRDYNYRTEEHSNPNYSNSNYSSPDFSNPNYSGSDYSSPDYSNPKVFRPNRNDKHRVRWTEVTDEDIVETPASKPRRLKSVPPTFVRRNEPRAEEHFNHHNREDLDKAFFDDERFEDRPAEEHFDEISLDFDDFMGNMDDEIYNNTKEMMDINALEYDTGRSGRKYTAEELESLIKE